MAWARRIVNMPIIIRREISDGSPYLRIKWFTYLMGSISVILLGLGCLQMNKSRLFSRYPSYGKSVGNRYYVVYTPGCRIYNFSPFEHSNLKYFSGDSLPSEKELDCDSEKMGNLITATRTGLYINEDYASNYTNETFTCCYRPFWRVSAPVGAASSPEHENVKIKYSQNCYQLDLYEVINFQFVKVTCVTETGNQIYEDYFTFAADESDEPIDSSGKRFLDMYEEMLGRRKISVLILGFEGISRLNFIREMPRTAHFFETNGGVSLMGYNKVGDDTFSNLIPVLTGLSKAEFAADCSAKNRSAADRCPQLIWKKFKSSGYFTAFGEDAGHLSSYVHLKRGLQEQPVDYNSELYFNEGDLKLPVKSRPAAADSIICVGRTPNVDRFQSVVLSFASSMKERPSFGLFWFTGLAHDDLSSPRLYDVTFRSMLDSLNDEGALDSTVVIALSDHGLQQGPFRATYQGLLEERLPLATILLPQDFKEEFPQATHNLIANAKRLTGPYDIHESLLDVLDHLRLPDSSVQVNHSFGLKGSSIFQPIPPGRTCSIAGIPKEWCACDDDIHPSYPNSALYNEMAIKAIKELNRLTANTNCQTLIFKRVISAMTSSTRRPRAHVIIFETTPGLGQFEARLLHVGFDRFQLEGTISRLTKYHQESHCIDEEPLKQYCYCPRVFINGSSRSTNLIVSRNGSL